MVKIQDIEAFYKHKFENTPALSPKGAGGFDVFRLRDAQSGRMTPAPYARYDFFKIMLIRGRHRCHYATKSISLDGSTLLFFNPSDPYQFERLTDLSTGYFCIFKEAFYTESLRKGFHELPLFTPGGRSIFNLDEKQEQQVILLFEKMLNEVNLDYRFKYDLLRNYVSELIHFALKMEPSDELYHHPDTNARITYIFIALLESQFPIDSSESRIILRSASDFARKLSLHVNHLNRAVRLTTGKTTTAHIAERMAAEATALLKHTSWNISEISDRLGFTQPSHFTYFFKKQTNSTPSSVRLV